MGRPRPVPNLIQGVSQQAPQQRRDSQCEAQFDCLNSSLRGAIARPPTEFVKLWPGRVLKGAFFHEIVRGGENYLTGVSGGLPFAIDLADGTDCAMSLSSPITYLQGATPRLQLRAQSVEDTTFLLNREVRPEMGSEVSPTRRPEAIVFVRSPAFATTYSVSLTGPGGEASGSYVTPSSDQPANAAAATTSAIAGSIGTAIDGESGYTARAAGSSILFYREDGQDFQVATADGNGDDFMYAFKGTISSFSKLPRRGFEGVVFKVQGESRTKDDDYYVRFEGPAATGSWVETIGPAVSLKLNDATMPHTLVQTGYRAFEFKRPTWSTRVAGDEKTSKPPSFVGKAVKDVFYHQSRLALLHEAGCVWSKARFPYTFFPDTAQTVLATAPVDIALAGSSATKGAALLDYAVQIDESLFLWAPRAQFRVTSGSEPFKQDTVEAPPATAYEYAQQCDPLALGTLLYTATEAGQYATIRSIQFSGGKTLGDIDITSHISAYIPNGIQGMAASDTLRTMFVYTAGEADQLYVYNYLLQDREYVQSAWNTWRIPGGEILWVGLQDNALSILQQRPEGVALLRVNLTDGLVDPIVGAEYRTRLDMLVNEAAVGSVSHNGSGNFSTVTLPYTPTGAALQFVTREDKANGFTRGRVFPVLSQTGNSVQVEGDLRGHKFYVGQTITALREESRFYLRGENGAEPTDRLTVERYRLELAETGYTRIEVKPDKLPTKITEYSGRTLGAASGMIGTPMIGEGTLDAKVGHLSKDVSIVLINDSFLPSSWQSAAFEVQAVGWSGEKGDGRR